MKKRVRNLVSDHRVTAFLGAAWRRRFDFPGFGPGGSPLGRSEAEADRGRGQASPGGQILCKIKRRRLEAERNAATPRDQLRNLGARSLAGLTVYLDLAQVKKLSETIKRHAEVCKGGRVGSGGSWRGVGAKSGLGQYLSI
jgi:hypothetical protein